MSSFSPDRPLRVAVLIDLPRTPLSGGHVKGWESRAQAASRTTNPIDLTLYFSGPESTEKLSERVCLRSLPPLFSTARLKFLPYMPDETDLAPYHPKLAQELKSFDLIHTTDAFFNFAKTAEKISRKFGIPLTTSLHTDTPSYTRIFTRKTIESLFGKGWLARLLMDKWNIPDRAGLKMEKKLRAHLKVSRHAMVACQEDLALVQEILRPEQISFMAPCIDKEMFSPQHKDRAGIERDYKIPQGRKIALFTGRVDIGKNIYVLIEAAEKLIAEGLPLHLMIAGVGPATKDIEERLKDHATLAGFVKPHELGRLYASVDFFAFPSEVETHSLVTLESLACGTPVLASEKTGIAERFSPRAITSVAGNSEAWANAMREMILNNSKREEMAKAALLYSQEKILTWEEYLTHAFFDVWERVAQEKTLT